MASTSIANNNSLSPRLEALLEYLDAQTDSFFTNGASISGHVGCCLSSGELHLGSLYPTAFRYELAEVETPLWRQLTGEDWDRVAVIVVHSARIRDPGSYEFVMKLLRKKDVRLEGCTVDRELLTDRWKRVKREEGLGTCLRATWKGWEVLG
jgi:hypothetical protein